MFKNNNSMRASLFTGGVLMLVLWSPVNMASQSTKDVEQCFNEAMQGKVGNAAKREANALCREQSSGNAPTGIELPAEAINKLKIDAGFGWGIFSGTIYNGNSEYLITQLTVNMTPIHDHHMEMMGHMSHEPKTHKIDLNLAPLSKSALSMALDAGDTHVHDFEWKILQVLGHKIN